MPISTFLRRAARRIAAVTVALALSLAVVQLSAPAARADPQQAVTDITWDITQLRYAGISAHDSYWDVIAQIHTISGHRAGPAQYALYETTTTRDRLIRINLVENGRDVGSLYYWANDLYLIGFRQPGQGTYAMSNNQRGTFDRVARVRSRPLPWLGDYPTLPGGSQQERAKSRIYPGALDNALLQISQAHTLLMTANGVRTLGRAMVMIIAATSEAARFSTVFDLIRGNIRYRTDTPLGGDNVALEQNWARISGWLYRAFQNREQPPLVINGRQFTTVTAVMAFIHWIDLFGNARSK
jgi:hypothetical protein